MPGQAFLYSMEDLLIWSKHTTLIEAAKVGSPLAGTRGAPVPADPIPTVPTYALAMLTAMQVRLEKLCQLQRVASDPGQWS